MTQYKKRSKLFFALILSVMGAAMATAVVSAAPPQFPNVYYGDALVAGKPAQLGHVVTAVVDRGKSTERHYSLAVSPVGKYGSGNGLKLKVSGDTQGNVADQALVEFFVTVGPLPFNPTSTPAGVSVFYADYMPHVLRLNVDQQ